ncbi:unnamed protein product [Rotaria sp. Silwood1]|nr:unnamed protein product [Rotaria sp. Silwood1]
MNAFDFNRDGRLDALEQADQREFNYADTNHDGALTRAEFARIKNPAKFDMYDTDHDGFVTSTEYARGEYLTEHICKHIRSYSFYGDENEVFLLPARQFEVIGCLNQGNGLQIIQLSKTKPTSPLIILSAS